MDDTLQTESEPSLALMLGKLLEDHHGGDVVVMDMRQLNFWTDFFVIATATSSTHLAGLERHIKEFAKEKDVEILHRSRRPKSGAEQQPDEWCLLDLGTIVVHLMSAKSRSFFELERLWSAAPLVYRAESPRF
ncbi:MAG: ribosome silencing factor [Treponema sp.]|nr:ribosome silencing factor [Treponema sp.]